MNSHEKFCYHRTVSIPRHDRILWHTRHKKWRSQSLIAIGREHESDLKPQIEIFSLSHAHLCRKRRAQKNLILMIEKTIEVLWFWLLKESSFKQLVQGPRIAKRLHLQPTCMYKWIRILSTRIVGLYNLAVSVCLEPVNLLWCAFHSKSIRCSSTHGFAKCSRRFTKALGM